ncbi:hypothetical protein K432DRAFT_165463 [Lepidopterella palustris CBS 459.81]|uniref:Uncharacterized protein n=1 Tax=Lepidopterella palustris CBS 459.81 TaxID=1314670 RepID=A0A8E2JAT5_9PEZI|nr:hypothetical protein K432DRAFT_165463 [Lepidopterella palustris CBS 459.81]
MKKKTIRSDGCTHVFWPLLALGCRPVSKTVKTSVLVASNLTLGRWWTNSCADIYPQYTSTNRNISQHVMHSCQTCTSFRWGGRCWGVAELGVGGVKRWVERTVVLV